MIPNTPFALLGDNKQGGKHAQHQQQEHHSEQSAFDRGQLRSDRGKLNSAAVAGLPKFRQPSRTNLLRAGSYRASSPRRSGNNISTSRTGTGRSDEGVTNHVRINACGSVVSNSMTPDGHKWSLSYINTAVFATAL